jgi:uncharacterized protein YggE
VKTIRITGKGRLKIRPDTTRITMTLEGVCPEYGEALHRSASDTEALRELLSGFGFARSDVKTLHFGVDTEYEDFEENGRWTRRFVGYRYRHAMKADFPSDNDRLGRILYALTACPAKPELRISYTVRDPEAAKDALLAEAVKDARAKAAVLTDAAGVALKEIQSIECAREEIDFTVRPMNGTFMAAKCRAAGTEDASLDVDIEPDDVDVSDTVTVVWEIG